MFFAIYNSTTGALFSESFGPAREDVVADDERLAERGLAFKSYASKPVNLWSTISRNYDIVPTGPAVSPEETQRLQLIAINPVSWTLLEVSRALTLILKTSRF